MMRVASLVLLTAVAVHVQAGDAAKGKEKSAACAACHGATGISAAPAFPNLAGQKEDYLKVQIKAFKTGTRKSDVMAPMVAALSDEDIDNLAAFFASQPCK